ncbi:hypothetical protein QLX08_005899 [Tetragonisca angustula]|uniref:Secreted protein n=1 Tax=Tetragonisca angustula TaxID=166442 RepID=A0AAW0ZYW7_9HYME
MSWRLRWILAAFCSVEGSSVPLSGHTATWAAATTRSLLTFLNTHLLVSSGRLRLLAGLGVRRAGGSGDALGSSDDR